MRPERISIVIDGELPSGLAINAAAVLAMTLGNRMEGVIGADVPDRDGLVHPGITTLNVPILRGSADLLRDLVLEAAKVDDIFATSFTSVAQAARAYGEYAAQLRDLGTADLTYVGVGLAGPTRAVNRLIGSLPLYR